MQVLNTRWGRGLGLGLCVALLSGLWAVSLADVVHFANGNSVRGKLDRMTGDIIEFRRNGHLFGNLDYFKRIQLTDRHDVVETRDGQKYFGEIIYLDGFLLEIQTSAGAVRLRRMDLTGVVLGSPLQAPKVPTMNQLPPQQVMAPPEPPPFSEADQPAVRSGGMTPVSNTGAARQFSHRIDVPEAGEDEDAIPAVDSNYRK